VKIGKDKLKGMASKAEEARNLSFFFPSVFKGSVTNKKLN
jgi:hypothetical protein